MKRWAVAAAAGALWACGEPVPPQSWDVPFEMFPAGKQGRPATESYCEPQPVDTSQCHPREVVDDAGRSAKVETHSAEPPAHWRMPFGTFPFGYDTPAACEEAAPFPDLATACRVDVIDRTGRVLEREERLGPNHTRRFREGLLVHEVQRDERGRLLSEYKRTSNHLDWQREEWRYDGETVLDHRFTFGTDQDGPRNVEELLTCDGRTHALVHGRCADSPRWYAYDSQGRLARIRQYFSVASYEEQLIYDDAGRFRVHTTGGMFARQTATYWDETGRVVRRYDGGENGGAAEQLQYGPFGVERIFLTGSYPLGDRYGYTEHRYDEEGRLLLSWKAHEFTGWETNGSIAPPTYEARRYTYACGSKSKIREELDNDRDGVADEWITWTAKPDGTVLEDSTTNLNERKVYRFRCGE